MITTHVLDTARGRPAVGVPVTLEWRGGDWEPAGAGVTDADGRCRDLLQRPRAAGVWRIRFDVGAWYRAQGVEAFYPTVEIVFEVRDLAQHHHVPLLIAPFGYSTYRGS